MFFSHKNKKRPKKKVGGEDPFVTKLGDVKYNKLEESSYRSEWIEGAYLSDSREGEIVGKTFDNSRLRSIMTGLTLLLLIVFGRAGWLQVAQGEYYSGMAEGNRIRVKEISAQRGVIYDRDHDPLVRNVANFILYLVPADLPQEEEEREAVIKEVADIVSSSSSGEQEESSVLAREIKEKVEEGGKEWSRSYEPLFVADRIPHKKAMILYLRSQEWGGVVLSTQSRRQYLLDASTPEDPSAKKEDGEKALRKETVESLSHVLGYAGKISEEELKGYGDDYSSLDYVGKAGIERFWEEELKGKKGEKRVEVDALGKEKRVISRIDSREGHNLLLSLDLQLQGMIERILEEHLEEAESSRAAVVAMDGDTGEILSLVSLPAYDNNKFARGITGKEYEAMISSSGNPLFNRAANGDYPPGSTFKPVVAAAALEEGIITERTSFESTGGIRVGRWFFPDWKAGGHGITDVRKALAESVNTFFYYIGGGYNDFNGLGMEKIVDYAKKFGLGAKTGIDLPSEANGFLPSREWKREKYGEQWYIGDIHNLAIGQGFVLLTPLQIANYTSVFANGGTLYEPYLVKEIRTPSGEAVREIKPDVIRDDVIDDYNISVVKEGMRQAVTSGSCGRLLSLDVEAAGKTGTAQWSGDSEPHAWFTGFAPYDDPEIVLTVLVEKGGDSAEVAVPIAEEIFRYYFDRNGEKDVE